MANQWQTTRRHCMCEKSASDKLRTARAHVKIQKVRVGTFMLKTMKCCVTNM